MNVASKKRKRLAQDITTVVVNRNIIEKIIGSSKQNHNTEACFEATVEDTKLQEDERVIWKALNESRHVLVSGKAGSGKSHLLKRFVSHLDTQKVKFQLCAPTAIAANNIGGQTIHKLLGLGLAEESSEKLLKLVKSNKFKYYKTYKFLMDTQILIIDEISMVDPLFFQKLDYLFRNLRNNPHPFGGVLLVMVGDFCQLGPVVKSHGKAQVEKFIFQTDLWMTMRLTRLVLIFNYRQTTDQLFIDILNQIRVGNLSSENSRALKKLKFKAKNVLESTRPVHIYPYKKMVEKVNQRELVKIQKETAARLYTFAPYVTTERHDVNIEMNNVDFIQANKIKNDWTTLSSMFPVVNFKVCLGSQVMMRCNSLQEEGIFNGSTGIVRNISNESITVEFEGKLSKIARHQFKQKVGETATVVLNQFPLCLSWAMTVHKVQGMTLGKIIVDIRNCFEPGQVYVALSRVRNIRDITIEGFDENNILTDRSAVEFETIFDESEKC